METPLPGVISGHQASLSHIPVQPLQMPRLSRCLRCPLRLVAGASQHQGVHGARRGAPGLSRTHSGSSLSQHFKGVGLQDPGIGWPWWSGRHSTRGHSLLPERPSRDVWGILVPEAIVVITPADLLGLEPPRRFWSQVRVVSHRLRGRGVPGRRFLPPVLDFHPHQQIVLNLARRHFWTPLVPTAGWRGPLRILNEIGYELECRNLTDRPAIPRRHHAGQGPSNLQDGGQQLHAFLRTDRFL